MPEPAGTWWYELDAQDRVAAVGGERDAFAPGSRAARVLAASVLGQSLGTVVDGLETAHVLRRIIGGVRKSGTAVEVPFRCDGPGMERHMQFRAAPVAGGRVRVTTRLLFEAPRAGPPPPPAAIPATGMIAMCSWCNNIRMADDTWLPTAEAAARLGMFAGARMPAITHGICAVCLEVVLPLVDATPSPADTQTAPRG